METVLLADDEIVFKAVEGTCLRRERCRLIKASTARLQSIARSSRPDLMLLSLRGEESRVPLLKICDDRDLAAIPIIVLDLMSEAGGEALASDVAARSGAVDRLVVSRRPSGRPDLTDLDARLNAAIKRHLSILDRLLDRVSLAVPVQCRRAGRTFSARTKDLSPSGLFLKTDRQLVPGDKLSVSFKLPAAPGEPASVAGSCEVVRRVGPGGLEDPDLIPGLGLRFVEMGAEGRRALNQLVRGTKTEH